MSFSKHFKSGPDCTITCYLDGAEVGQLERISWAITREPAPIYTMGPQAPKEFSRGKRKIAGSLIFSKYDPEKVVALLQALSRKWFPDNKPWFTDQIPVLNIKIERPRGVINLLGVEILNEGSPQIIFDIKPGEQETFIARYTDLKEVAFF